MNLKPTWLPFLDSMPELLSRASVELSPELLRAHGGRFPFSFLEHVWHLADLEREGFGVRIHRLLAEDAPVLPDFDGERHWRERSYQQGDLSLALAMFADSRRRNLTRLRALTDAELARAGTQDEVGPVCLSDVARMMVEHDGGHALEVVDLLEQIAPESRALDAFRERSQYDAVLSTRRAA